MSKRYAIFLTALFCGFLTFFSSMTSVVFQPHQPRPGLL